MTALTLGYIPLTDAAPLIAAKELGFAADEGLALALRPAPSWSALRDMLRAGQVSAAHMLSPVPVAAALGLGGTGEALSALSVLSVNGNVIGVSAALAAQMKEEGHGFDFSDAAAAGRALSEASPGPLRLGVPFPFSMHMELVTYWLTALGLYDPRKISVRTVPPPLMGEALRKGEIDAFCVGEPWGSAAVENGFGTLILPGSAIWSFAPEKVLATRTAWAEDNPDTAARLIRALWRAGRWLAMPGSHTLAAELLSRPAYLNLAPEVIDRALTGRLVITPGGSERRVDGFLEFHNHAACLPWPAQAEWIGARLAARYGLDRTDAARRARAVFLSDIFRAALDGTPAILPASSAVPAPGGFFDGQVFTAGQN
jgi:NitT/TauT family transport system ATP-binding protein